jgi:hypothetical protein
MVVFRSKPGEAMPGDESASEYPRIKTAPGAKTETTLHQR